MRIARSLLIATCALGLAIDVGYGQSEPSHCPVDGRAVTANEHTRTIWVNELRLQFCKIECLRTFATGPEKFLDATVHCPVFRDKTVKVGDRRRRIVNNNVYYLC